MKFSPGEDVWEKPMTKITLDGECLNVGYLETPSNGPVTPILQMKEIRVDKVGNLMRSHTSNKNQNILRNCRAVVKAELPSLKILRGL